MTLERHQALAEIESRLAGSERLRENYFRFGGLEACLAEAVSRPSLPDLSHSDAEGVSRPTPNPYPSVFGPIRIWPSGTRTQDLLPTPCARCLHSLNFQPFPLLHTLT